MVRSPLSERAKDRIAIAAIRGGGWLVIALVAAIVVGIAVAALPLFSGAALTPPTAVRVDGTPLAVGWDPRGERSWWLDQEGIFRAPDGDELCRVEGPTAPLAAAASEAGGLTAVLDLEATVRVGSLRFEPASGPDRGPAPAHWRPLAAPLALDAGAAWRGVAVNRDGDDGVVVLAWSRDRVAAHAWSGEVWEALPVPADGGARSAAVAEGLATAALVRADGSLTVLRLPDGAPEAVAAPPEDLSAVRFLVGGGSLVAAGSGGEVSVLQALRRVELCNASPRPQRLGRLEIPAGGRTIMADDDLGARVAHRPELAVAPAPPLWRVVRRLRPLAAAPTALAAAPSGRSFALGGADGSLAVYHATTGSRRVAARWPAAPLGVLAMAPRGNALTGGGPGRLVVAGLRDPHPEVSLRSLLLPVTYEGYAGPRLIWQTSGGDDTFERKLSISPLIVGTLKATLYAMLVSVPLALAAAIYVSQLAPPRLQAVVKPTVELMAAVPSVVVGFLAALWLAPRLEALLLPVLMTVAALPLVVVVAVGAWRLLPAGLRRRAPAGIEIPLLAGAGAAVIGAAWLLAGPVEAQLFGGDLGRWLFAEWGLRYDQRNAFVVGVALGFAVIPVIFTIAEDACSSVPRSLTHAARALGATRWQAAVRMVVPAASPGLFAAVILGFGRAVGETMIVLMASGNTPVLDLGPFNGMRTMAAAIAVEIPEAAVGGTLYRVLFFTGLVLFAFTFAITTAAGAVGRALRRRYARF